MGNTSSKIKYNLHQMNKEIIHQAAQAHAEKSFIQPLATQEVM
jgi:GDP-D-mannose dehydratase